MSIYEEQKERIEAIYAKWRNVLGLDEWEVSRSYEDGEYVMGDGRRSGEAAASTDVRWQYRDAVITFNVRVLANYDDEHAESIVIHECMHIILHEMRDDTDDLKHEERVATSLAWAFLRTEPKRD